MSEVKDIESLVGKHILDAVARTDVRHPFDSNANGIMWFMDGKIYAVYEDPDDGYRSSAGPIFVAAGEAYRIGGFDVEYINRPIVARMAKKGAGDWYEPHILELVDCETGHTWLRVGTDNYDDYYPSFVGDWFPMPAERNKEQSR